MERASDYYKDCLKKDERAKNYLIKRGLSGEVAKRFGIGYAPSRLAKFRACIWSVFAI
jgi:DNA primase